MNPFVNPNKRDVSLPPGCKDLMDVLKQGGLQFAEMRPGDLTGVLKNFVSGYTKALQEGSVEVPDQHAIGVFVRLVLLQAHHDHATELVFGVAPPDRGAPIRYKTGEVWHDIWPFPSEFRPRVISEIAQMARLPDGPYPKEGVLKVALLNKVWSEWNVTMTSPDGDCILTLRCGAEASIWFGPPSI